MTKADIELIIDFLYQDNILGGGNNGCSDCIYDKRCNGQYSCIDGITEYIFKEMIK